MTQKEKIEAAKIINNAFASANFDLTIPQVTWQDILDRPGYITFQGNNPFDFIFGHLARGRIYDYGQFTHFKSLDIAISIINSKSIQISNLKSNQENDYSEFTEFLRRMEFYHHLLPQNYCQQVASKTFNPGVPSAADIDRENIFILCFAQDCHNDKFWLNYSNDDRGVAINFKFRFYHPDHLAKYDFRDVYYDNGYDFDFVTFINYYFKQKFSRVLLPGGFVKFARFYKRAKYNWEHETRLSFHFDPTMPFGLGTAFVNDFPIHTDPVSGRKFLNIPLSGNPLGNPYFDLDIVEVVCGRNVTSADYIRLQTALNASYPKANLWKRL